jgi:hypothetical protein
VRERAGKRCAEDDGVKEIRKLSSHERWVVFQSSWRMQVNLLAYIESSLLRIEIKTAEGLDIPRSIYVKSPTRPCQGYLPAVASVVFDDREP